MVGLFKPDLDQALVLEHQQYSVRCCRAGYKTKFEDHAGLLLGSQDFAAGPPLHRNVILIND